MPRGVAPIKHLSAEIEADIRRRAQFHKETENVRDSFTRAIFDREMLIAEVDLLREENAILKARIGIPQGYPVK